MNMASNGMLWLLNLMLQPPVTVGPPATVRPPNYYTTPPTPTFEVLKPDTCTSLLPSWYISMNTSNDDGWYLSPYVLDSCDDNGSDSYYCSPVCHHNQHSQNNQYLTCESECRGVNGVGYGNSNISLMGYPTKYARFYTIYANSFR